MMNICCRYEVYSILMPNDTLQALNRAREKAYNYKKIRDDFKNSLIDDNLLGILQIITNTTCIPRLCSCISLKICTPSFFDKNESVKCI